MSLHGSPLFINALSTQLAERLQGNRFIEAFSTGKDELYLVFDPITLKVHFWRGEALFSFPDSDHLPRKNRISQFKEAAGLLTDRVETFHLERAFQIHIGSYFIFFKLFGARANVLFGENDTPKVSFRHNLRRDLESGVTTLQSSSSSIQDIQWKEETSFNAAYPFLRGDLTKWIFSVPEVNEQKRRVEMVKKAIDQPEWGVKEDNGYELVLSGAGQEGPDLIVSGSALEVSDLFSRKYYSYNRLRSERERVLKELQTALIRSSEKILQLDHALGKRQGSSKYKHYADVLMANLWQIETGLTQVELTDFDGETVLMIPLKKDMSPQKNAERYYRKAKNEHLEIERLNSELQYQTAQKVQLQEDIRKAEHAKFVSDLPVAGQKKSEGEKENLPYKVFQISGFEIWVGKSAESNEVILRKATKFDTWLHARDVPGSHVLIRNKEQRTIPVAVLEVAASLAAGHSKRKSEGLVAVIYSERRYIRKFKGAKPGQVKVDREQVILVPPLTRPG